MTTKRHRSVPGVCAPRHGDTCWEVEWCSHIPLNEFGDGDLDRCVMHVKSYKWEQRAREYAKRVFPQDAFGSVRITPMEFVAYAPGDPLTVGFWEATGESTFEEGE